MKVQDIENAARHAARVTELRLYKTDVSVLSALLPGMPNLRLLHIENCRLRRLPDAIGHCTLMDTLILDRNLLEALPESLGNCTRLFRLSAAHNRIAAFPGSLKACLNLRRVNASHNRIAQWPELFARLPWLAQLELSYNRIAAIPDFTPGAFSQLKYLDIGRNELSFLPEFTELLRLETLLLGSNRIAKLPKLQEKMPALEKLDVSGNPLSELPPLPEKLVSLNIAACPLPELPEPLFAAERLRKIKGLSRGAGPKLVQFLGACRKRKLPEVLRPVLFAAYRSDANFLNSLEPSACLQALALPLPVLRERIIRHLTHRSAAPPSMPAGTEFACAGRFPLPAPALQKKLAMAGMAMAPLAQAKCIVLGKPPYNMIPAAIREDACFISDKMFFDLLDASDPAPSLLRAEQILQLRRMLSLAAGGNTTLAARIIQSSGLPDGLHTELLYAWMQAPPGPLKSDLRKLLERHTPADERRILRLPLKAWAVHDPGRLEMRLREALKNTVFDAEMLFRLWMSPT